MNIPTNWQQQENKLSRDYVFENFEQAMAFVNKVAVLAEEKNHHPDILIFSYCNVKLTLLTHDEGNICTDKDIQLALALNNL